MPLYSHSTGSRTVYAPGSRLAKSRTSQSMQTLLWRPSLSGGGGTKSAFHSTGQSTTSARRIRFHPSHGPRMGRPSGPPLRQSTHLDLVEIRQCVPDIEGTKVAVAPRLLLLPGGGRALWGDVVGYGGRSGGGEGGGGGARALESEWEMDNHEMELAGQVVAEQIRNERPWEFPPVCLRYSLRHHFPR